MNVVPFFLMKEQNKYRWEGLFASTGIKKKKKFSYVVSVVNDDTITGRCLKFKKKKK